ncbi:hypothetical protein [Acinetobacter indicus]|uniref:hypothetical protein n=1 Tax=Acinetobacter indicus TaxID=756892 RepID=UPI00396A13C5
MYHQYHCSCCNQVVTSTEKECPNCGSHNIRSPYGFWMFCILSCLAFAVILKVVHVYLQDHQETPTQPTLLEVLKQESS